MGKYYHDALYPIHNRVSRLLVFIMALLMLPEIASAAITVYVESTTTPYIYVWYTPNGGTQQTPNGSFNSAGAMTNLSNGWYKYTAPDDATSINFILKSSSAGGDDSKLTEDETATSDVYYKVNGNSASTTDDRPNSSEPSDNSNGFTERSLTKGYYLVGSYLWNDNNDDANNTISASDYKNPVFRFSENANGYSVIIPASITANIQIMEVGANGMPVAIYGPSGSYSVHGGNPTEGKSINGAFISTSETAFPTSQIPNYWSVKTRNSSNNIAGNDVGDYTDGIYTLTFTLTDGKPSNWTIAHDWSQRVSYYFCDSDPEAMAMPIFDSRTNSSSAFTNKFYGSVNMTKDVNYYVLNNYIKVGNNDGKDYYQYLDSKYKATINSKVNNITPTANKLFFFGNGGKDFTDQRPNNDVYPKEKPFHVNSFVGTYIVEFNPSNGEDTQTKNHGGMGGQIILRNGNDPIKSVSMVGPAIAGTTEGSNWLWSSTNGDMTYDNIENCYKFELTTDNNNWVKHFRFVKNHKEETNWHENSTSGDEPQAGDKAKASETGYDYQSATLSGHSASPVDNNEVSPLTSNDNYSTYSDGKWDILWNRPAGRWTVKFYINTTNVNGNDYTTYYYTINENRNIQLRDYGVVWYKGNQRNIIGIGSTNNTDGHKFFATWSDSKAWKKPANIKAYVVSNVTSATEESAAKVTLTELTDGYLPANTGMILVAEDASETGKITILDNHDGTGFNLLDEELEDWTDPTATYTGTSKLTCMIDPAIVPTNTEAGGTNYLFGFYKAQKADPNHNPTYSANDFLLGFWRSKAGKVNYANSAYLSLTASEVGKYGIGNSYNMTTSASGAKYMPAVLIDFDNQTTTGISTVESEQESNNNDKYYTITGVAIDKPLAKGIYIHKGKKIIVR